MYEYKTIIFSPVMGNLGKILDKRAADGWRYLGNLNNILIFERKKTKPRKRRTTRTKLSK